MLALLNTSLQSYWRNVWTLLWVYIRKRYYIYEYPTKEKWAQIWEFCCSLPHVGSQHPDRLSGRFRSSQNEEKSPNWKITCQKSSAKELLMMLLSTSYKYEQHLWARDRKTSNETESALGQKNVNPLKYMKKKSCLKVKRLLSLWDIETSFLLAPQASFQAEPAGLTKIHFITM